MKLNIPQIDDAIIYCQTNPEEFAAAKWRATVFLYQIEERPQDVPGLGLAFHNFDAGKKIIDGWLARLGATDPANELRVSIIEGPIPSDKDGYTILIGTNPPI